MRERMIFKPENLGAFQAQIVHWLKKYDVFCVLNSNTLQYAPHPYSYSKYDFMVAVGEHQRYSPLNHCSIHSLSTELEKNKNWKFGFFSYDLKNEFEHLSSSNTDHLQWPDFYFFSPEILILLDKNEVSIQIAQGASKLPNEVYLEIINTRLIKGTNHRVEIKPRLGKADYIKNIDLLKKHILRGDIYEINYCQEFYSRSGFEPFDAYINLNQISPTPFSAFFRLKDKFLLSASPERFLQKTGDLLISQPHKRYICPYC